MIIHFCKSEELYATEFANICDFFSVYNGPMKFKVLDVDQEKGKELFTDSTIHHAHKFPYPSQTSLINLDLDRGFPLSWRELFLRCNVIRAENKIKDTDFVVLFTHRKNALTWFSAADGHRNIFVNTDDWTTYTNANPVFPIASQVIEQVIKSLMNVIGSAPLNAFNHDPVQGCINDFCSNKNQIIIKLQTGNICDSCLDKLQNEGISNSILSQISEILHGIRSAFIFKLSQTPSLPSRIVVDKNMKILLPERDVEISLQPLWKTLYIFLLTHEKGVSVVNISDHHQALLSLYQRIKPGMPNDRARKTIDRLTLADGDEFNSSRTNINKVLVEKLARPFADFYTITGERGKSYRVKLPKDLIDIRW